MENNGKNCSFVNIFDYINLIKKFSKEKWELLKKWVIYVLYNSSVIVLQKNCIIITHSFR